MRIVMFAFGSQGDVRPSVALGAGLRRAGYEVRFGTDRAFEPMIGDAGLQFTPIAGDIRSLLQGEQGRDLLATGGNPVRLALSILRLMRPTLLQMFDEIWAACQDADAVVLAGASALGGSSVAEKLGIPFVQTNLLPMTATRAFPSPLAPRLPGPLGFAYNRLTSDIIMQAFWQPFRPIINSWRRSFLKLPTLPPWVTPARLAHGSPMLYGFSPAVIPPPPDWDEHTHVTGYWFLDSPSHWEPPASLRAFLDAGPPPVYVGFGSLSTKSPQETTALVVRALERAGQRGVLVTGWGGLGAADLPPTMYAAQSLPHDWLFPRMAAIVHHGGAGTTAAGLRAGVPSILIPFFADQPFWARHVTALGVGPAAIPHRHLTVERLAEAVHAALTDEGMRTRARLLGERVRAEDGVGEAVRVIQSFVESQVQR